MGLVKQNARARAKARYQRVERARRQPPSFTARRTALALMIAAGFLAVTASAFYRQVLETEFLRDQGEKRYLRDREIAARRGMIIDRNGQPLAVSTAVETVWCDPKLVIARDDALPALAKALELSPAELREKLEAAVRADKHFIYLRRRAEPHIADAVEAAIDGHRLHGIGIDTEYRRFYPGGEMLGHVVGYTNIDDAGQEGMELIYETALAARPGARRVIQDGRGRVVEEVEQVRPPHHGQDLVLSIDRRLQFLAYRELMRTVEEHRAVSGSAAVVDATTGEVLALVNQPSFNPNKPRTEPADTRRNRGLTDVFEPGSTIKPFVVAAGLEAGVITPKTPINTSPGSYAVGGHTVRDVHNYGAMDVTKVVTKSSNVGVVKIAQKMDKATLWTLYDALGFGRPTGVGFPGERSGHLSSYKRWSNFEHATLAFGYGLNVTTLQLAQAYTVLASDGTRRPLTLFKRDSIPPGERVLSEDTVRKVRLMMETVVSDQGTARRAKIPGYKVAGKTGTAKKATGRGYAAGKYQAVFAGMAPATQPRFVMVVMIDEPRGSAYYGGLVAAPMFAKVMETALRLYNVPPDDADRSLLLASLREDQGAAHEPKGKGKP